MRLFYNFGSSYCFLLLCHYSPNRFYAATLLLRFLDQIQLDIHTQSVRLLWTSGQMVAKAATYTRHNIHNRWTSMFPAGFDPVIPTIKRPQTYTLDRTVTGIGRRQINCLNYTAWRDDHYENTAWRDDHYENTA